MHETDDSASLHAAKDRRRLGKVQTSLTFRSACTIFAKRLEECQPDKAISTMKNTIIATLMLLLCTQFAAIAQQQDTIIIINNTTIGKETVQDSIRTDSIAANDTILTNDTIAISDTLASDTIAAVATDSAATSETAEESIAGDSATATSDAAIDATEAAATMTFADSIADIRKIFDSALDSIIARYDTLTVDLNDIDGIERTNPTFIKLYMRPTLYRSALSASYGKDIKFGDRTTDTQMNADAKRQKVIDGMLLQLYRDNPSLVWATEDEIRKETTLSDEDKFNHMSGITLTAIPPIVMPENVTGDLKTKVVKPNYWRTYANLGVNYTQNFFSDNWHSGGEDTKNMLIEVDFKLKYDDKKKVQFENILEAKLGFYTAPSDTVHNIKTNQDLLRFTTKLNYKGMKDFYYTIQGQVWTQSLPFYDTNQTEYRSNFMAPFNANFSFGIDYKPNLSKGTLSVYLAPLSAYNYRFVRYGDLAHKHYGIRKGRHHFEDFGTKLEVNGSFQIFKNFAWKTRFYYYTTYARVEHDWENTFRLTINKYLSASVFVHTRFDDKARSQYSSKYGYWQIYEKMMLGFTYSW